MKILLALIALGMLFLNCAKELPSKPSYETQFGEECATDCESDYSDCLESNLRPDFSVMSPRKAACEKFIRDCYQLCEKKEKKRTPASNQ